MSKWKPKSGDTYYWIDTYFEVVQDAYLSDDSMRIEAGNCFRSYDEAAEVAEKFKSIIKEQQITEQLPKLTVEVFDREDCPDWAEWAAVDYDCNAFYYDAEPELRNAMWSIKHKRARVEFIAGGYDSSDYRHSLIRRPENNKLPSWCKCGALIWHKNLGYAKITSIEIVMFKTRVNIATLDGNAKGFFNVATFKENCREARMDIDLEDLVGRKVRNVNSGSIKLITHAYPQDLTVSMGDSVRVPYSSLFLGAPYQLIGKPKYKYEHLEDGKWKE